MSRKRNWGWARRYARSARKYAERVALQQSRRKRHGTSTRRSPAFAIRLVGRLRGDSASPRGPAAEMSSAVRPI